MSGRPGETATFIGLEFRIGSPTITRPSSRLVGKWRDAVARARGGRDEYAARELAGLTVAVVERAALPLAVAGELTRPRTGALSRAEEADATAVEARLAGGGWSRVVQPPGTCRMTSDASLRGWGVVLARDDGTTRAWAGQFDGGDEAINILELRAVAHAVALAPPDVEIRIDVDSSVAVGWITRGTAPTRIARALLLRIDAELVRKGATLLAQWIPSSRNAADGLSCGAASEEWMPPPWHHNGQRRVLGGRAEVGGQE